VTFRKFDLGGFKGTFTLSAKPGESITIHVAEHVPAGDDLERLSVRSRHSDLPGTKIGFTKTGTLMLTGPTTDAVYDAFFFPQIDTTVYWRGQRLPGDGSPVNYGCLDSYEPEVRARPTVAGVYTPGMTPPWPFFVIRAGVEPIASEAVKRLNEAWRVFPDFAVHRIDLDLNARSAPFMMGLAASREGYSVYHSPEFVLIDPAASGSYDLVEIMVAETFLALFVGWSVGPCAHHELLNPEDNAVGGISDVGKKVLYYFAVR
jgi:hypothetical protein